MRVLKLKIRIRNMSDTLTLDPTHWPRNPVPAEKCLSVMHWCVVVSLNTVGKTCEHIVMCVEVFGIDDFHFVVGIHLYNHGICRSHFESHLPSVSLEILRCASRCTLCATEVIQLEFFPWYLHPKMTFRHTACALLSFWASFEAGGCIVKVLVSLGCSSIAYCVLIQ